jgi:tetratricopeptide (TPR) repeat protein
MVDRGQRLGWWGLGTLTSVQESSAQDDEDAALARELEAELETYPDERGEILIEAADAWHRAGEHEYALDLLARAVALGGDDAGYAYFATSDMLFDLDRVDEAREALAALRSLRPPSAGPYHMAGELLEERGEFQEALVWFNMAYSRLSEEEMSPDLGPLSYAVNILQGRRRVREAIGIPPDELDTSLPEAGSALSPFTAEDELRDGPTQAESGHGVQVLFWPREEIPEAHRRWPEMVAHDDAEAVCHDRELANRELAEAGYPRITLVPLRTAELSEFAEATGSDPGEQATKAACMAAALARGETIGWPPGRNEPCWCGSGRKYKKCCGRPNIADRSA